MCVRDGRRRRIPLAVWRASLRERQRRPPSIAVGLWRARQGEGAAADDAHVGELDE